MISNYSEFIPSRSRHWSKVWKMLKK